MNNLVKNEPIPYYRTHRTHNRAISDILGEIRRENSDDDSSDDSNDSSDECVIVGGTSSFPKPLASTTSDMLADMIKKENDIFSGKIPFIETVSIYLNKTRNKID